MSSVPSGVANTDAAHAPRIDEATPDITDADGSSRDLDTASFADFGVSAPLVEALAEVGITHPFPIQALTLPIALKRQDIIGQAKTGTGKTLGFALPILEDVRGPEEDGADGVFSLGSPQAMIVLPTRELAKQVAGDVRQAATHRHIRVAEIYGGVAFEPQIEALERGVEIIVGTPGRMIDLLKRGILHLSAVRTVVLDEADEMLDLGFLPDVETLLSRAPANRHTMLFSATMPGQVVALARRYMSQPTHIRAQDPEDGGATVRTTRQVIYRCHALNKIEVVSRILQAKERGLTMVFTRTKRTAARVAEELGERGFATAALHGDLGQGAREQALRAFRKGKVDVLVATDVAARGIDVDDVTHVINYQCPEDARTYIHRVGRTGRAGHTGTAVTFVDWDDVPRWRVINKEIGLDQPEPLETYHTSAHLYSDLDIPTDAGPRLPRAQRTRSGLKSEEIEDLGETGTPAGRGRSRGRSRRRSGGSASSRSRSSHGDAPRGGRRRRNRSRRRRSGSDD
ncbi:DEAD/DEAH box helicase [Nanchangia anserum]|nr:DEAD/DEAH box helicase [Nanchangia anserum]